MVDPSDGLVSRSLDQLLARALPEGGFAERPKGQYRTDATAWAAIVLDVLGSRELYERAAQRLTKDQLPDGRVPIDASHPTVWWPTSLAAIAWAGTDTFRVHQDRALQLILHVSGTTPKKEADDPIGHDTTLQGWSWVEGTHSWIEPTALSLLALDAGGVTDQPRFLEGIRLLLNRQLPHGGWNYGNRTVLGRELNPMPESTGAALAAMASRVPKSEIQRSLSYLEGEITRLRTPVSLGWALLGLAAWNAWPPAGGEAIRTCLEAQRRYGEFDTSSLSLLMLAAARGGTIKMGSLSNDNTRVA